MDFGKLNIKDVYALGYKVIVINEAIVPDSQRKIVSLTSRGVNSVIKLTMHKDITNSGFAVTKTSFEYLYHSNDLIRMVLWELKYTNKLISIKRKTVSDPIYIELSHEEFEPVQKGNCVTEEFMSSKADALKEYEVTTDPNRKAQLKLFSTRDLFYLDEYYVLIWGRQHPWNHISRTPFYRSHQVNLQSATICYKVHGFNWAPKYNPATVKMEINTEPSLPPLTYVSRIEVLKQFIEKKKIERNNSRNTYRLWRYLEQCVCWYHGKMLPFWKTTAEYRHRWKNHVDWILGSPTLNAQVQVFEKITEGAEEKLVKNHGVQIKPSLTIIKTKISDEDRLVRHSKDEDKPVIGVVTESPGKKRTYKRLDPCICGYSHPVGMTGEDPDSIRGIIKYNPNSLIRTVGDEKHYRFFNADIRAPANPIFKKDFIVPRRKHKTKSIKIYTEKDIKTENYYVKLGSEVPLDDPMPVFLSPLASDHVRDYPWTENQILKARKKANSKMVVKTKANSDSNKVPKKKHEKYEDQKKRVINPKLREHFDCQHVYKRKCTSTSAMPMQQYLDSKNITNEKILMVINRSRREYSLDSFLSRKLAKAVPKGIYTRREHKLIMQLFDYELQSVKHSEEIY